MAETQTKQFAVVLPAGGARAAYQVGVLQYLAEQCPDFQPSIYCGISAGSINTCFLSQGEPFHTAVPELKRLWSKLYFDDVFATHFRSLASLVSRWVYDLFMSKMTRRLLMKSLLDASPLAGTLLTHIQFWKIRRAIEKRKLLGVSVTATNYHTGDCTVFYDSADRVEPWARQDRVAIPTALRVRHVMASCSIPLLFEPVRVGNALFGDGSLRYSFPFSPAIHLGATHVLGVSLRPPHRTDPTQFSPEQVSMGFVAGAVMNSVFMDSMEPDYETLQRMNRLSHSGAVRPITPLLLRPSQDPASLCGNALEDFPFHFRQMLRSTAQPGELNNLMSYLLFSPTYIQALIALGYQDAEKQRPQLEAFVKG